MLSFWIVFYASWAVGRKDATWLMVLLGDFAIADGWAASENEAVAGLVDESGGVEVVDCVLHECVAADI
jgi:hypothetical protein